MNDSERKLWVENDEGLYRWYKSSRQSLTAFVQENRTEIDEGIKRVMG